MIHCNWISGTIVIVVIHCDWLSQAIVIIVIGPPGMVDESDQVEIQGLFGFAELPFA